MSEKVDFNDDELPQERYEGVDPDEWVSLLNLIFIFYSLIISLLNNLIFTEKRLNQVYQEEHNSKFDILRLI